jgi:hypothetical protein
VFIYLLEHPFFFGERIQRIIQASSAVTIQGTLTGESGVPVRGAYVLVHEYYPSNSQNVAQNWEMRADAQGHFSFDVQVGCDDVFISETRFFPHSERVCVDDGHNVALKLKMKADPHPRVTLQD